MDLDLFWTGDGVTPLSWAAAADFPEASALSVFEGYLINRNDLDRPFRLETWMFDDAGYLELEWPSDGLPNGEPVLRTSDRLDLPAAERLTLDGALSFADGVTRWRSVAPVDLDGAHFFRMKVE